MIYIDASCYLAALMPNDSNRPKAQKFSEFLTENANNLITANAILGEVLTIGSQRFDREKTVAYVSEIRSGKTKIVLENQELITAASVIFKRISAKNVGWVDCFSFAIIKQYKIKTALSFDRDFKKYAGCKVLGV